MNRGKTTPIGLFALMAMVGLNGCATYIPAPVNLAQMRTPVVLAADLNADVTSDQLLRFALARDPAIAAARATLVASEHDRKAAAQLPAMSAALTLEYARQADASDPWLFGGALGVPLDIGVRHNSRVTTADLAVLKARYALADVVWRTRQRLRQAQGDLGLARMRIGLSQRLLDQCLAAESLAERLVRSGEAAQSVLLQARLERSTAGQGLLQAQAQYDLALAGLALALNTDAAHVAKVPGLSEPLLDEGRVKALTNRAFYTRGDIASAISDYDSAETDLRLAVVQQYPDMMISPGYTWERGVAKIPLGLSLNLPPLDGNRAHIEAAQSRRLAVGKSLEDRVRSVQADMEQAALTWRADLALANKIQTDDLPQAKDLAQQSLKRLQAGDLDQGAVLAAQIAETQTELTLLQARQTAMNDRLKLEEALHQSLSGDDEGTLKNALSEVAK